MIPHCGLIALQWKKPTKQPCLKYTSRARSRATSPRQTATTAPSSASAKSSQAAQRDGRQELWRALLRNWRVRWLSSCGRRDFCKRSEEQAASARQNAHLLPAPHFSCRNLRCHARIQQVFANEEEHIVGAVGGTDGAALPLPLPDVLDGEAEVEFRIGRRVIAVAEPEPGANTAIFLLPGAVVVGSIGNARGRLVAFIPPGTHVVLVVGVALLVAGDVAADIVAAGDDDRDIFSDGGTAIGIVEADVGVVTQVPGVGPRGIIGQANG